MEIFAKGQLSYMILNCLLERDFYGLDFISEISNKSNGRINLKKPSVYSNLTRMEKQGYVSSYSKASDFGPNRRYYSITEKGRNYYQQLKNDFSENNIDVFRDFKIENEQTDILANITDNSESEDDKDFFDFSSLNNAEKETREPIESINITNSNQYIKNENQEQKNNVENLQQKVMNNETTLNTIQENNSVQEKDDGAFLNREQVDNYNQRLYDISKDIRKYKKQRSFAEDQIAMTVETPLQESEEKNRANLEAFKASLLENKEKFIDNKDDFYRFNERQNRNSYSESKESKQIKGNTYFQNKPINEVVEDDGKFITNRLENEELIKPKKIQPPRLKILQNDKSDALPPPNRDVKIDPSHKEIISQLYSRTKDGREEEGNGLNALYDYQDLQEFYDEQNVSFKEYKKTNIEVKHNTNKLFFIQSLIVFFLLSIFSSITYIALYYSGLINSTFNFLFILLPALQLIVISIKFYNYKCHTSWIPKKMASVWEIFGYTLLIVAAIIGINFIFGLNTNNFELYATTTLLPVILTIVALPVAYFIKRALIVKYWK